MISLVLDAGALVAVDRDDRAVLARLRAAQRHGLDLRTSAVVVAQVWRDPRGRQVRLGRFLRAVDVHPVDDDVGRAAGVLLGRAGRADVIDAVLLLLAAPGDRVLTSDPDDIRQLAAVAVRAVEVVPC